MKKNDIFTFTAPNGVEITAVVIDKVPCTGGVMTDTLYCYSQNRIFTYIETVGLHKYGEIIVDYAILPDYDEWLARYNDIEVAQAETNIGM
jgi:hypothetical protein